MNQRSTRSYVQRRMLSVTEAADYCNLGPTKAREWFKEIGAEKRLGKRVLIDLKVVDEALDKL